jgi:hypothetical protein
MVNWTAGPVKQSGAVLVALMLVTGPSVAVNPDPKLTVRLPGLGDADCTGLGGTVVSAVGEGLALGDLVGDAVGTAFTVPFAVGFAVGFAVDCPVEPDDVPVAAAVEATALAAAESAGAELATPVDDTAALASVLDVAAAAGLDDPALLLCDEPEHPERASAATTVAPTHPVTRKRTVMAFPPEGMRPTIDDGMRRGARSQNFATFHRMCLANCSRTRLR